MKTENFDELNNRVAHLEALVAQLAFFHETTIGDIATLQEVAEEIDEHLGLGLDINMRMLQMTQEVMAEQTVSAVALETAVQRTRNCLSQREGL